MHPSNPSIIIVVIELEMGLRGYMAREVVTPGERVIELSICRQYKHASWLTAKKLEAQTSDTCQTEFVYL